MTTDELLKKLQELQKKGKIKMWDSSDIDDLYDIQGDNVDIADKYSKRTLILAFCCGFLPPIATYSDSAFSCVTLVTLGSDYVFGYSNFNGAISYFHRKLYFTPSGNSCFIIFGVHYYINMFTRCDFIER